ncbi:spore protein [Parapedobacter sp. DT-150]|uniref:spore protein n=1 Tax=Parapedobacter sp. DT-150 TaxID=3396162 RepID=UPI003F1B3CFA
MGVTRLKRKDRKNKVVAKNQVQFLKLGRNLEAGSRSKLPASSQIVKNNAVLDQLETTLKK